MEPSQSAPRREAGPPLSARMQALYGAMLVVAFFGGTIASSYMGQAVAFSKEVLVSRNGSGILAGGLRAETQAGTMAQAIPSDEVGGPGDGEHAALPSAQAAGEKKIVQVFAFDDKSQMRMMLIDWLLSGSHVLPQIDGDTRTVELQISPGGFSGKGLSQAFSLVQKTKPFFALWLLPFKDGDKNHLLPTLEQQFQASTSRGQRHGVLHWTPEFCDQKGTNPRAIAAAYRHVEFVFMFGYLDDRLAKRDKFKFLPFPLGPAISRGWQSPRAVKPTADRPLLAAFRGSSNTHTQELSAMQTSVEKMGPSLQKKVVIESRGSWKYKDNALDHTRYLELLATSKFALSPPGHNPNTYRIAEAVESGSTPLLVPGARGCYGNWAGLYGHVTPGSTQYTWIPRAPFAVIKSWADLGGYLSAKAQDTEDATPKLRVWYSRWRQSFLDQLNRRIRFKGGGQDQDKEKQDNR